MVKNKLLDEKDNWMLLMIVLWISLKDATRSQSFYSFLFFFFGFMLSFTQITFFSMCQNISLITRKYLIANGVEQAPIHIPILFRQIRLLFLPFLLFLPLKEHACTHTDLILSYYLPAVRLRCQALKRVLFFKHQQQQHLDLCNFNIGWFPSFLLGLPGTCECPVHTEWHQTVVGNLILLA